MESRMGTQSRMDLMDSVAVGGMGAVMSAWIAEERNCILGQELPECGLGVLRKGT